MKKQLKKEFEILLSGINDHLVTYDTKWRFTFVNDAAAKVLGKSREELLGKCIWELFPDAVGNQYYLALHKAARTNKFISFEHYYPPFKKWFENHIYPFDGGVTVFATDITARKNAESSLFESEERFRNMADAAAVLIGMGDEKGNALYLNKAYLTFLGKSMKDVEKFGYVDVIHPDDLPKLMNEYKKALKKHTPFETEGRYRRSGGEYRWLLVSSAPRFTADGTFVGFIGTHLDITDRKKAEDAVKMSEERYRALFNSIDEGFCVVEVMVDKKNKPVDYLVLETNSVFDQQTGFVSIIGKTARELHLEQQWIDLYGNVAISGKATRFEQYSELLGRWFDVYASQFGGEKSRKVAIVFRNITERKQLEQQKDEFIGIASHELKTPVTSIKAYTQVLQQRFKKAADVRSAEMVGKMDIQLNKLTNLIADLLDITKIEQGKLQFRKVSFDLNELLSEIIEEMQRTTDKHSIIKKFSSSKNILGDRDRIGQVINNFLTNAIKYSPNANKIIVKTTIAKSNGERKNNIIISVTDFGVGLTKEDSAKVFERFYRVSGAKQNTYPGLGLGLYISAEIIKRHNGHIQVESSKGEGSTFSFSLPLQSTAV